MPQKKEITKWQFLCRTPGGVRVVPRASPRGYNEGLTFDRGFKCQAARECGNSFGRRSGRKSDAVAGLARGSRDRFYAADRFVGLAKQRREGRYSGRPVGISRKPAAAIDTLRLQ